MSDLAPDSSLDQTTDYDALDDIPLNVFAARRLDSSKRRRRVQQVRLAIATDEYENDLKISIAADRIIDALFDNK